MLGKLHTHENKDAGGHMAATYNRILIVNEQGEFETLLITNHELARLRKRVSKNEADVIEPSWSDKLQRALSGVLFL